MTNISIGEIGGGIATPKASVFMPQNVSKGTEGTVLFSAEAASRQNRDAQLAAQQEGETFSARIAQQVTEQGIHTTWLQMAGIEKRDATVEASEIQTEKEDQHPAKQKETAKEELLLINGSPLAEKSNTLPQEKLTVATLQNELLKFKQDITKTYGETLWELLHTQQYLLGFLRNLQRKEDEEDGGPLGLILRLLAFVFDFVMTQGNTIIEENYQGIHR